MHHSSQSGLLFGLAAYGLWGVIPIYFRMLNQFADSYDILAHRIVWSALMLMIVLTLLKGNWAKLYAVSKKPRMVLALILSSALIACNWFVYIYGVETQRVVQCSLGYFITPLVNVAMGVFLLGERVRYWQVVALACGVIGMILLASLTDSFPWIALSLATTFSLYGLMRKFQPVDTLTGLTAETLILAPLAAWYVFQIGSAWPSADAAGRWLLIFSGPATVIPLFCFGQAARLLPLSTLGFLQYLSPSLQFLVAVFLFREPVNVTQAVSFGIVWLGLVIYSCDLILAQRRKANTMKTMLGS